MVEDVACIRGALGRPREDAADAPPSRIDAAGAGGAESSFDAWRAAPLLLSQVAALHALRRL